MNTTRRTTDTSKMSSQAFSCCNNNEEFQRSIDFSENKNNDKSSSNLPDGALTGYRRRINYESASGSGRNDKENQGDHLDTISTQSSSSSIRSLRINASKTFQSLRTTMDTISQKLRRSTRRRYRLEAPTSASRDDAPSPVRMYSPFRIETPAKRRSGGGGAGAGSISMGTPGRYTPRRRMAAFKSPGNNLRRDVEALRRGTAQLDELARSIVLRRSVRR